MKRLIILDRDGVMNIDTDDYVRRPDEWRPIPGSLEAVAALTRAGNDIGVATNQSGIARGYYDEDTLDAIHDKMHRMIEEAGGHIGFVASCPHGPEDGCDCRKPQPGLLLQIADHFDASLAGVPYVGDKLSDVEAALAAGARPILVRPGYGARTEALLGPEHNVEIFDDLSQFAESWLAQTEID